MKIFILLISFYSSISFGACVPGNIACQNAEIQYFKGQTAPYATPSAGFANLYFDQSVSQGITPRWQDSLATVYPIIGKIVSNRTIYVATTGNDTTGTGLIGAPYLTPQKALDWLMNYRLGSGVEILIDVAAGQYLLTTSINPQHPQGSQITIQGQNVAVPPVAGDFAIPVGAPNPTAAQRETAANADLAMLRGKYPTELRFTATDIDGIKTTQKINLKNLLISGTYLPNTNATAAPAMGIVVGYSSLLPTASYIISGKIFTDVVSVHGFKAHGFYSVLSSSLSNAGTATASNNGSIGFFSYLSSSLSNAGTATASNNGSIGFFSQSSSSLSNAGTATASNNGGSGFVSQLSSSISNYSTATASNNGIHGFYSVLSSSISNNGGTSASGNTGTGVGASGMSSVYRGVVGGGGVQSYSPAFGVVGNNNSLIY